MNYLVYLISAFFSVIMLFNGVLKHCGKMSLEAAEAVYVKHRLTERQKRNWDYFQKIEGKAWLICGGINLLTQLLLFPLTQELIGLWKNGVVEEGVLGLYAIAPSLLYMICCKAVLEILLWKKDKINGGT